MVAGAPLRENALDGINSTKTNIWKRKLPGKPGKPPKTAHLKTVFCFQTLESFTMNGHSDKHSGEAVIRYCLTQTKNTDRAQAMVYGRLSGYFDEDNKLTLSGQYLAKFLQLDA